MAQYIRKQARARVRRRIRKKISGTAARPRLAVHFSNKNVYAQLIDDVTGKTIASASTKDGEVGVTGASIASATKVGEVIAQRAKASSIDAAVFDRGGFIYHGKVKALADAAREAGLEF
ncbi:50S ribosomal protein L18 [Verrucomicrobiales bacterium]|nr:50S ribosomal protein L18 [Verrucomicrobiales bacterium]MDB4657393.1 50S ribosomal protein L18 [Verrucomicrobiales bacterium]MDC0291813.1 50S ribosomal protein L18 [Verrucomicrobiales bacterium]